MTLWKHCPVGLIKHVLFWYSDFNHLVSINGRLCLQFIRAPLDSRSIPSETLLTWLHKSALVLQIESTQDTFIILSLDCGVCAGSMQIRAMICLSVRSSLTASWVKNVSQTSAGQLNIQITDCVIRPDINERYEPMHSKEWINRRSLLNLTVALVFLSACTSSTEILCNICKPQLSHEQLKAQVHTNVVHMTTGSSFSEVEKLSCIHRTDYIHIVEKLHACIDCKPGFITAETCEVSLRQN